MSSSGRARVSVALAPWGGKWTAAALGVRLQSWGAAVPPAEAGTELGLDSASLPARAGPLQPHEAQGLCGVVPGPPRGHAGLLQLSTKRREVKPSQQNPVAARRPPGPRLPQLCVWRLAAAPCPGGGSGGGGPATSPRLVRGNSLWQRPTNAFSP